MAEPDEFTLALAQLVQDLGLVDGAAQPESAPQPRQRPMRDRRGLPYMQTGAEADAHGLPFMPPLPRNALAGEMRNSLSPEVDAIMGATGLPTGVGPALDLIYKVGEAGPRQVQKAEGAIGRAIDDPSVGSIANAGTQVGMAALRPSIALPSLAVQYGNAIIKDLGIGDSSAQAQQAKKGAAPAPKLPGLTPDQQSIYDAAQKRLTNQDYGSSAERRQIEKTMDDLRTLSSNIQLGKATSEQGVEADAKLRERAEYDRAVKRAEEARDVELGKRKTFQDTNTGKAWDETGGLAPIAIGAVPAFFGRAMNPNQTLLKSGGMGAAAGAFGTNIPLGYDAYATPVEIPERRAYEAYSRELPPTHPRKEEWQGYARGLPAGNPIREEAQKELFHERNAPKRLFFGAGEGALGGEIGHGAWAIPARFFNALGRGAKELASPLLPGGPRPSTGGGAPSGTPSGSNALAGPTAGQAVAGPTPPVPSGGTPQRQLPAPGASPNQSALPSWASEPPAGVPKLPRDVYWDKTLNQPRHKNGKTYEMPKYRHPRETPTD